MSRGGSKFREEIVSIIGAAGSLSEAARLLGVDKSNLDKLRKGTMAPKPATVGAICRQMQDKKAARSLAEAYLSDVSVKLGLSE